MASRLGRLRSAEEAAERALTQHPEQPLPQSLRLDAALAGARAAQAQDHLEAAARMLEAALAVEEQHPEALSSLGRVLSRLGDAPGARTALAKCLELEFSDLDRALHLTLLAEVEEAAGEDDAALDHFREAIALDPTREEAHAGLTRALVRGEHREEAVDALVAWADRATNPEDAAPRRLQAAELVLAQPAGAGDETGEALLRAALAEMPELPMAWSMLCDLLFRQGRGNELVEAAGEALAQTLDASEQARISLLRARALEQRGDAREAAEAFAFACEADPRCTEGALSAARLLRGLGSWQDAADALRRFIETAPEDAGSACAPALHQLGRLLAGPLEDVEGAIEVYRDALARDGSLGEAQEALADLLVHRPAHWDEAIARHRDILAEQPARLASLRGLLRIARGREKADATACGLSILRALGSATPNERIEAPARPPRTLPGKPALTDPVHEAVRKAAVEAASEIAQALGVGNTPVGGDPEASDATSRFRSLATEAERRLAAAALVPLPTSEVGETLVLLAELATEVESLSGDGNLVNALSAALPRRARRRVRKALGDVDAEQIATIDWEAWRTELRGLAAAAALADGDEELRTAFLASLQGEDADGTRDLAPESDIRERVAACGETRALLRHVTAAWLGAL